MVRRRPGHTLAELLVTLAFLGTTMAAVTVGVVHGARSTAAADRAQRAIGLAAAVLDSLAAVSRPADGERVEDGFRVSWAVSPGSAPHEVEVAVRSVPLERTLLRLRSVWAPPPPVLGRP